MECLQCILFTCRYTAAVAASAAVAAAAAAAATAGRIDHIAAAAQGGETAPSTNTHTHTGGEREREEGGLLPFPRSFIWYLAHSLHSLQYVDDLLTSVRRV